MLSVAAVVVAQALVAAGCMPPMCPEGCTVKTTYSKPERKSNWAWCSAAGKVVDIFVQNSCEEAVSPTSQLSGWCRESSEHPAAAECTGRGYCMRSMVVREIVSKCDCSAQKVQCKSDENCPLGEWCRAKQLPNGMCSATETECVPRAKEGAACGGRTTACSRTQCGDRLVCEGEGLAADKPGTCQQAIWCAAVPQCQDGLGDGTGCQAEDFLHGRCTKVTLCGSTIACRTAPF